MIQKEYMVTTRNPTKSREISFDILRIMASFAVMMIHISSQNWYEVDIYSYEWMIFSFYDSISRWGVPIFVMISGALFLGNCRSIKRIYKRNIFRIITAFIFWSFFYASIMFVCGCSLKEALACFFRGFYHMWFLFMIIGLYMITPFLVAIVKDKKLINYFLLLSLLFAFALPQCISIISMISSEYGTFLQSLVGKMHLEFVMGFTFYYILGYQINNSIFSKKFLKLICILGLLGFLVTILATLYVSFKLKNPSELFYECNTINVLLETIFVFCFIKYFVSKFKFKDKYKKILLELSNYSFGAYLVHPFVIMVLKHFSLNTLSFNPIISVPAICLIVFVLSYLISALFNKIPSLGDYIV